MKIKTKGQIGLSDEAFVITCMDKLSKRYPSIVGYTWERLDELHINLLVWGDWVIVD